MVSQLDDKKITNKKDTINDIIIKKIIMQHCSALEKKINNIEEYSAEVLFLPATVLAIPGLTLLLPTEKTMDRTTHFTHDLHVFGPVLEIISVNISLYLSLSGAKEQ